MEMEKFLNKKYKLQRCENLDEILIEMGINSIMRKVAKTITTVLQLTKKDDLYSLNSTALMLFTASQKFKLGESKDVTTSDGRKVQNIFTVEGNKLIEKQIGERTLIIEREFFDDHLITVTKFDGSEIVCTSWSKISES